VGSALCAIADRVAALGAERGTLRAAPERTAAEDARWRSSKRPHGRQLGLSARPRRPADGVGSGPAGAGEALPAA